MKLLLFYALGVYLIFFISGTTSTTPTAADCRHKPTAFLPSGARNTPSILNRPNPAGNT